jgi:hypothetical protein
MFTSLRTAFRDGHGHRSGRFASRCELLGRPSISSETDGSHGRRQDVGVSSRAHRSIRPREQGSAQGAISRDGNSNPGSAEPLRVATRVGSTAGPVGALVGHQCPVTPSALSGTVRRTEAAPRPSGREAARFSATTRARSWSVTLARGVGFVRILRKGVPSAPRHIRRRQPRLTAAEPRSSYGAVGSPIAAAPFPLRPSGRGVVWEATDHLGDRHTRRREGRGGADDDGRRAKAAVTRHGC